MQAQAVPEVKSRPQKIYVAGHRGMVGSAIVRTLLAQGVSPQNIVYRTRDELDLCNQSAVQDFFNKERPTQVYLAAAKVGGIHANNTYPADFIYQNLIGHPRCAQPRRAKTVVFGLKLYLPPFGHAAHA